MNKIRFIIDNYIDTANISAEPSMDVNLPVANVKESSKSKVARSVGNANQTIRGSFSTAKEVSAIVIGRHNFVIDMQYKIYLYNNSTIDNDYVNTGGLESANDDFYIPGNYASIFIGGVNFDVIGDTSYTDNCLNGVNNVKPAQDVFRVVTDQTSIYTAGTKFDYTGDTNTTSNKTYTIVSSVFSSPNTEITVEEDTDTAGFDGTLAPYARYTVNTGGAVENSTTYSVTGGTDNTDPTNDIFFVAGDQTSIFDIADLVTCSNDTNSGSNITYTIVSTTYNGGAGRTEITVENNVSNHNFDGDLLPIYTTIPVTTNIITSPNFDGTILPDFLVWDSGTLNVTTESVGSTLWEWGAFLWGSEGWGSDQIVAEYTPPANIVEWIPIVQTGIRGFKLELLTAGGSVAYFEVGRLIIGKYIQPTYNIGYGHSLTWEESTKQYRTDSGSLRSDNSIPYRKFEFNIGTITEADRIVLQHELRNAGLRRDLFISLFPEDVSLEKKTDYSGIVKMTKVPKFTEFAQNYYKSKYIMEEV